MDEVDGMAGNEDRGGMNVSFQSIVFYMSLVGRGEMILCLQSKGC